jgi:hypothetical protein
MGLPFAALRRASAPSTPKELHNLTQRQTNGPGRLRKVGTNTSFGAGGLGAGSVSSPVARFPKNAGMSTRSIPFHFEQNEELAVGRD